MPFQGFASRPEILQGRRMKKYRKTVMPVHWVIIAVNKRGL